MTNLSKELCEICGIERKGKLIFRKRDWDGRSWISAGHGYKEFDFESVPETSVDIIPTKDYDEKNGFQYPYSDIERIKREYDKNGYDFVEFSQRTIDFTKPDNFVRLFDLTLPQKGIPTIAEFVTYEHLTITDSKDFLAKLIEMLKDDSYVADVKKTIRETEWVYD